MMANEQPDFSEDPRTSDPTREAAAKAAGDEAFTESEGSVEAADDGGDPEDPQATIERLEQELKTAQNDVLRAEADKQNFLRRTKNEYESMLRFATLPLLSDLVQVQDNLDRALAAAGDGAEAAGLRDGVAMVSKQLSDTLAKHHCRPIPAVGEAFDPNYHEAIQQAPSTEYAAGIVSMEVTKGYQLHDRIVRASQVIVSTGPPAGADPSNG